MFYKLHLKMLGLEMSANARHAPVKDAGQPQHRVARSAWVWLIGLLIASTVMAGSPEALVAVSRGSHLTPAGDRIDFLLFVPQADPTIAIPPYPALVLTHGFARDYGRHIDNALRYARDGVIVMTPNLIGTTESAELQSRSASNTADHVRWLIARATDPTDPLFGVLDPDRIALAGHSAGGANSLEAAVLLQDEGTPVAGLVLLDAVPYAETIRAARRLAPLPLLSLRSAAGACNAYGVVKWLEQALTFPFESRQIRNGTHCDPESPTDAVCELACGGSSEAARTTYRDLTNQFLHETFGGAADAPSSN